MDKTGLKGERGENVYKEMIPCIVCHKPFPMKLSSTYTLKKVSSRFEVMCTSCFDKEAHRFIEQLPFEYRTPPKKKRKKAIPA